MPHAEFERLNQMALQRGEPFRVLIVDDEKWVRETFRDFCGLTSAFDVEMAFSGAEAIDKVRVNKYDLVTVDLIMPELSGLDVLSEIKRISPHLPVMIITGNATDKLINQAGLMGACRVLYKPVVLETFIAEIASTLIK
jgi:DNA-binding NtrC family response regulator